MLGRINLLINTRRRIGALCLTRILQLRLHVTADSSSRNAEVLSRRTVSDLATLVVNGFDRQTDVSRAGIYFLPLLYHGSTRVFRRLTRDKNFQRVRFTTRHVMNDLFTLRNA